MSRKQLRVLCLHGFRTSGRIMKMQMRDVIRFCPNVDFVFVGTFECHFSIVSIRLNTNVPITDAPHDAKGEAHEIVRRIWNPKDFKYFEWWDRDEETKRYVGVERSISYVKEVFKDKGPFDGVLGFSQGGAFAATLCAMRSDLSWLSCLRFGTLFSAFVPRDEALSDVFKKMKENKDFNMWMTCGEKEEAFFHEAIDKDKKNSFPNLFGRRSVVVKHPTGHEFPLMCRDGEDTLRSLSLFLKNQELK